MFLRFMKKTNSGASHRKNSNVWLHTQESNHVVTTTDRLSCEACTQRFLLAQTLVNLLCVLLHVCINSMVRFMLCCFFSFLFGLMTVPSEASFPSSEENILVAPCVFKEDYMSTCAPCHQVPRRWPGIVSDTSGCIPIVESTNGNKPAGNFPG